MNDTTAQAPEAEDRVIWRADLYETLGVGSESVRRWMKSGKLPPPDVDISQKTRGWRLSTLHAAGIRIV
jgi:predicted DNA-binding transcriptional regulator AlpA